MMDLLNDLGGRKFVFAILIVIIVFLLALFGEITFEQFTGTILWAFGIFSAANVTQKFTGK